MYLKCRLLNSSAANNCLTLLTDFSINANCVNPDQTAPWAVWSGFTLFFIAAFSNILWTRGVFNINIFQSCWDFSRFWTSTKQRMMCLAQGQNKEAPVKLEPVTLRYQAEYSTTELHIQLLKIDIKFEITPYPICRCKTTRKYKIWNLRNFDFAQVSYLVHYLRDCNSKLEL